jgi:hypothetical protein
MRVSKEFGIGLLVVGVLALPAGSAFATPLDYPGTAYATGTILIDSAGIFFSDVTDTGPDTDPWPGSPALSKIVCRALPL